MEHDKWSQMGADRLGDFDKDIADMHKMGYFTLMKCIINDYWSNESQHAKNIKQWDRETIDDVMSKLYYCWLKLGLALEETENDL